jgi:hypothetical protein
VDPVAPATANDLSMLCFLDHLQGTLGNEQNSYGQFLNICNNRHLPLQVHICSTVNQILNYSYVAITDTSHLQWHESIRNRIDRNAMVKGKFNEPYVNYLVSMSLGTGRMCRREIDSL